MIMHIYSMYTVNAYESTLIPSVVWKGNLTEFKYRASTHITILCVVNLMYYLDI